MKTNLIKISNLISYALDFLKNIINLYAPVLFVKSIA